MPPKLDFDRPSQHGAALGELLVVLYEAGAKVYDGELPPRCATCAFTRGTVPNQSAGTGVHAMHCTIGTDKANFACHHGLVDGQPQRLCSGYVVARLAGRDITMEALRVMKAHLDKIEGQPDKVRAAFDQWFIEQGFDETCTYEIARLYEKHRYGKGQ